MKTKQNMISIGSILAQYRKNNNLSIEEVARYFSDNIDVVKKWENDELFPSIHDCLVLSKLYAASLDDMFCDIHIAPNATECVIEEYEKDCYYSRLMNRWYA